MMVFEKEYFEALNYIVVDQHESTTRKQVELLNNEVQKLSPKCKKVFLLCKKEGLTYIEIADHLKISTKTLENHMVKGFSILRKKMKEKIILLILMIFGIRKQVES